MDLVTTSGGRNRPPQPTRVLLVRHAHTEAVGRRLAGRTPGVLLSARGRDEAAAVGAQLASNTLQAIYSSPLERAVATASAIARAHGLPVTRDPDLTEVDFGEWTGLAFDLLERLPAWRDFNAHRATAIVPGGEAAPAAQARIVRALTRIRRTHRGQTVVAVTHADIIRYALLHAAGAPLDDVHTLTVPPASVHTLQMA